jgi:hypothetical protein
MEKLQQIVARTLFLYWVSKPQDPGDLDLKKLFREKTERFALFAAGVLTLILSMVGLSMASSAGSPLGKAEELKKPTAALKSALNNAQPGPDDVPSDADKTKQLDTFRIRTIDSSARYLGNALFATAAPLDDRRAQPKVLLPSEGRAAVVMAQARTYIFVDDDKSIIALKDPKVTGVDGSIRQFNELRGGPGGRGGHRAPGPSGDPRQGRPDQVQGVEAKKPALKAEQIPLSKLGNEEDVKGARLAVQTRPLRMAIVTASFPYVDQLHEFRRTVHGNKLQLRDVLDEMIKEPVKTFSDDGEKTEILDRPAFRFREVEMQRRVVDATGWPVDPVSGQPLPNKDDGWGGGLDEKGQPREPLARKMDRRDDSDPEHWTVDQAGAERHRDARGALTDVLDLRTRYRRWLFLAGSVVQPEDEAMLPALTPGLWMPRLRQMREDQYPSEDNLTILKKAREDYAKGDVKDKADSRPRQFQTDNYDPFGGSTIVSSRDPRNQVPPPRDPRDPRDPNRPQGPEIKPISHLLIRLIDVDIEPGKIYEYRIRVRMTNPNYGKKDVANPKFADHIELPPSDWYVIPDKVVVPQELEIYAVDERSGNTEPLPKDATAMQIHRWIDILKKKEYIGEWSVAERVVVHRGEPVDRTHKVEVPMWDFARETFLLLGAVDNEPGKPKKVAGVDVYFGNLDRVPSREGGDTDPARPSKLPTILVDFEGGRMSYAHKGERPINEDARTEVLIMSPDGKLMSHNSSLDKADKARQDRVATWKARLDEVRKGTKPSGSGTSTDPFGERRP